MKTDKNHSEIDNIIQLQEFPIKGKELDEFACEHYECEKEDCSTEFEDEKMTLMLFLKENYLKKITWNRVMCISVIRYNIDDIHTRIYYTLFDKASDIIHQYKFLLKEGVTLEAEKIDPSVFVVVFCRWDLDEYVDENGDVIDLDRFLQNDAFEEEIDMLANILRKKDKKFIDWKSIYTVKNILHYQSDGVRTEIRLYDANNEQQHFFESFYQTENEFMN